MVGYLTTISLAEQIGKQEVAILLRESLAQVRKAHDKLRKIAANLLSGAPKKAAA